MKRKRFLAVLTAASLSASMALTAMPVFAGDVVSVEASDANTVTDPEVDVNSSTDKTNIATGLKNAAITVGTSTSSKDGWTVADTTGTDDSDSSVTYSYVVTGVSDITFAADDGASDLKSAKVTLNLAVAKGTQGLGSATIVVDLLDATTVSAFSSLKFTAAQKIAAVKTVLDAKSKDTAITYDSNDNVITVATKLGFYDSANKKVAIPSTASNLAKFNVSTDDSSNGTVAGATDVSVDIAVGKITEATTSTDGSVPYTVTYKASDVDAKGNKTEQTATSSITGKIDKTKAQNDSAYATKIQNAIEAATWTTDDFTTDGTKLSSQGKVKLVNLIKGADDNTLASYTGTIADDDVKLVKVDSTKATTQTADDGAVTISRYTAGTHGKDGSAHVQFFTARQDGKASRSETVDSFDVDLTIKEGDAHVKSELKDSFKAALNGLDVKTVQSGNKAASEDEVKAAIKTAIDAKLAKTFNGKTYASDIKDYEIVVTKYNKSTVDAFGNVLFYIKVDTGRTSSEDPTKTDVWYFNATSAGTKDIATPDDNSYTTAGNMPNYTSVDTAKSDDAAKDATQYNIVNLPKLTKVAATGITLPSTITYNVNVAGKLNSTSTTANAIKNDAATGIALKDYLKFTPADATDWTIRWTLSNTTDYALLAVDKDGYDVIGSTLTTTDARTLPTLKLKNDAATTTLTAQLLDDDGNVVSTATTTITAKQGFDDVQNRNSYYYTPVNNLTSTKKVDRSTKYYVTTTTTNDVAYSKSGTTYYYTTDSTDSNIVSGAPNYYKVVSSPVVDGVGNNKFDPAADVTRGQFITFLWRDAVNKYSFEDATTRAYTKDPASYTATTKFSDVAADKYYAKAIAWAVDNGIVNGKTDTTFAPDAKITRAEAVTMLYRLKANGAKYSHRWQFTDVNDGAYYADAVAYAANNGITVGKSDTVFAPNDNVTRAEAVTFISRAGYTQGYGTFVE